MKPLNEQQQKEAIELIDTLCSMPVDGWLSEDYIESAKDFLQSLKPKICICIIDEEEEIGFLQGFHNDNIVSPEWRPLIQLAKQFKSIEEAREVLNSIQKDDGFKYFILTE